MSVLQEVSCIRAGPGVSSTLISCADPLPHPWPTRSHMNCNAGETASRAHRELLSGS